MDPYLWINDIIIGRGTKFELDANVSRRCKKILMENEITLIKPMKNSVVVFFEDGRIQFSHKLLNDVLSLVSDVTITNNYASENYKVLQQIYNTFTTL